MRKVESEVWNVEFSRVPRWRIDLEGAIRSAQTKHVLYGNTDPIGVCHLSHLMRKVACVTNLPPKRRVHHNGVRTHQSGKLRASFKLGSRFIAENVVGEKEDGCMDGEDGEIESSRKKIKHPGIEGFLIIRNHHLHSLGTCILGKAKRILEAEGEETAGADSEMAHELRVETLCKQ
jgi:hypothetical protein